jgi:uncharacterized protein (DUF58 family)
VAIVSTLHAGANLRGLRLSSAPISPVFAGERLRVPVFASAADRRAHVSVRVKARGASESVDFHEVRSSQDARGELWIEPTERGFFEELRLNASSLYPLGFFTARLTVIVRQPHYIYPAADGAMPLPVTAALAKHPGSGARLEGDDFAGLRAYRSGESQRHIDWKAAARGQGLVIKQWAGEADETLQLTWADTTGLAHEARLSQLTRWIVVAERQGRSYGLAVPGATIAPGRGTTHYHECLRTLAVFPREAELA